MLLKVVSQLTEDKQPTEKAAVVAIDEDYSKLTDVERSIKIFAWVEQQIKEEASFMFKSTPELAKAKKGGMQDSYFGQIPTDSFAVVEEAIEEFKEIKEEERKIMGRKSKDFYENIYDKITIGNVGS